MVEHKETKIKNKYFSNTKSIKYEELTKGIDAVIFDMDGTLADSMHIWKDIDIEFLKNRGIEMPEDLQASIRGISLYQIAIYFINRFGFKDTPEELIKEWNDMAFDMYSTKIELKPGALKLIKRLKEDNIKMAIASSNSGYLLEGFVKHYDLDRYFSYYCTGDKFKKGKPAPDCYLHTAEMINIPPSKCLVFEDITEGIQSAKSAGMLVCGVSDDYSKNDIEEKYLLSDFYVDSLEELF